MSAPVILLFLLVMLGLVGMSAWLWFEIQDLRRLTKDHEVRLVHLREYLLRNISTPMAGGANRITPTTVFPSSQVPPPLTIVPPPRGFEGPPTGAPPNHSYNATEGAPAPETSAAPAEREGADAPAAAVPFSKSLVRACYERWCIEGVRPSPTSDVAIQALRYLRSEPKQELGANKHVLIDAPQIADFVRFSPSDGQTALVLPHPEATYSVVLMHLYPDLTPESHASRVSLPNLEPVTLLHREDGAWETA